MPKSEIPAKGFTLHHGKRKPDNLTGKAYVQIRGCSERTRGWVDSVPWPVETTNWVHEGAAGDVMAWKDAE